MMKYSYLKHFKKSKRDMAAIPKNHHLDSYNIKSIFPFLERFNEKEK